MSNKVKKSQSPSNLLVVLSILCLQTHLSMAQENSPLSPIIPATTISWKALPWASACRAPVDGRKMDCDIPQPYLGLGAQELSIQTKPVFKLGEAASASQRFEWSDMVVDLTVFSVAPLPTSGFPPYLQIRFEILSPVRALCLQSVRWKVPFEMPTLICASLSPNQSEQIGLTVFQVLAP